MSKNEPLALTKSSAEPDSQPGEEALIEPAPDRTRRAVMLADYGLPDDGAVGAAIYASRVLIRRLNLRMARQRIEGSLKLARKTLDVALLPLGKALCAQQEDTALNELAPMFEAVEAARRAARDQDTARENVRASSAHVQRELDDSMASSEVTASRLRAQESELVAQETALRTQHKRAQGLLQRCDIELRAMQTAASPPDPAKVSALMKQREERAHDLQQANEKLTTLLSQLGELRRALASARGVMSDLDGKRRAQQARHEKVDKKHAKHTAKAHNALDSAMIELAAVALDKNLADITSEAGSAVARARSRVEELQHQVDDHIAADTVYDEVAYAQGVRIVIGLGVASLAIAAFAIAG